MSEKPTRAELERMNKGPLQTYAIDAGLGIDEAWTKDEIIEQMVAAGLTAEEQGSEQTEDTVDRAGYRRSRESAPLKNSERVWVMIPSTEAPGGDCAVHLGVNGRNIIVPRDKWCLVGVEYIEVLEHAITGDYYLDGYDNDGCPRWRERDSRRFAFSTKPAS